MELARRSEYAIFKQEFPTDCGLTRLEDARTDHIHLSIMKRVKRQHFNPQTYLRRFADDNGQVMVYDRTTGKTWKTHIRNAAVENDLYTVYDSSGNPSDIYETSWIQWFDDGVADVLARLLDLNAPLTTADQKFLCMFLAFQHMRSPYMGQTMGNITDLMVRSEIAANVEGKSHEEIDQFIDEWLADWPEGERKKYRRIGYDLSIPLEIETEAWIRASLRHVPDIAESLETRAWALVEIQDASLLTADIPLALAGPMLFVSRAPHRSFGQYLHPACCYSVLQEVMMAAHLSGFLSNRTSLLRSIGSLRPLPRGTFFGTRRRILSQA